MAKNLTVEVKSKGDVIGTCEVKQYDSVEEALAELTGEVVLKQLNAKIKSDATNNVRVQHSQNTPEKQIARITRDMRNGKIVKKDATAQIRELLATLDAE